MCLEGYKNFAFCYKGNILSTKFLPNIKQPKKKNMYSDVGEVLPSHADLDCWSTNTLQGFIQDFRVGGGGGGKMRA